MLEFLAMAQECAPTVSPQTMAAVVNVESGYNPYAIGVVGGRLAHQPKSHEEAVVTAKQLELDGWNFSLGVAQVNRHNLPKFGINYEQAFDPCTSLRVGSKILEDCYVRATKRTPEQQAALQAAFSCYYSGNFTRGFKPDQAGKPSYVQKVLTSADNAPSVIPMAATNSKPALMLAKATTPTPQAIPVVPSIKTGNGPKPQFDKAASAAAPTALTAKTRPLADPNALPSDNSPVLLRPATRGAATLKKLATDSPAGEPNSVTKTTPEPAERLSSAIVF